MNYQKKFKLLSTKGYRFLLGKMFFTRDGGFHNMFVYQPTLHKTE